MRNSVLAGALLLLFVNAGACARAQQNMPAQEGQPQALRSVPLTITTRTGAVLRYQVEVAQTAREQAMGLMYRKRLAPNHGMIFPMRPMRPASFWMANTYISLDIIFIAPDGRIESIAAKTTPLSRDPVSSRGPVAAVLELNGGTAAAAGLAAGDLVEWQKP